MPTQATLLAAAVDLGRLCLWLALLSIVFVPLERLFALRPASILRKGIWADVGYYFLSGVLPGLVLSVPLAALAAAGHAVVPHPVQAGLAAAPLWLKVLLALFIGEVGAYWGHRWTHEIPFLWRFHAVHHEAEHMDFLVNTRAHPIDLVFVRLCTLAPLYVVGLAGPTGAEGSLVPALMVLIGVAWGFFIHANIRWRFGLFEWVVATPAFHHWHHTISGPINRNYAPMFPLLDKLFGTMHLPRGEWPAEYGIEPPAQAERRVSDAG